MLKKIFLKIFTFLGYEISRINKEGTHIYRLKKYIDLLNINLVLDVGANKGQFARKVRNIGYEGKILSFEPLNEVYEELMINSLNDKKWDIHPKCAVGNSNSDILINVSKNFASSSVLNILDEHLNSAGDSKYINSYTVNQIKLDDIKIEKDYNSIFLKIDVQGYELDVLKGAEQLLKNVSLIKVEISFTKLYQDSTNWKSLIDFLFQKGFEIWDIENGFRNPNNFKLLQSDIILVNSYYLK